MEIEETLEKINLKLDRLRRKGNKMRIGSHQFELSNNDPIFQLTGPTRKEIPTGSCVSCRNHVFESNSEMLFCQFCGQSNCEKCFYKERMFPHGKINADGQKPRGKICKLCDRKFIMR